MKAKLTSFIEDILKEDPDKLFKSRELVDLYMAYTRLWGTSIFIITVSIFVYFVYLPRKLHSTKRRRVAYVNAIYEVKYRYLLPKY